MGRMPATLMRSRLITRERGFAPRGPRAVSARDRNPSMRSQVSAVLPIAISRRTAISALMPLRPEIPLVKLLPCDPQEPRPRP